MKNLLNFLLCFSLLLLVGNSVNAIDQDHSPPIEMQYEMPEGVSIIVFNIEKSNAIESALTPVTILEIEIERGGLYALRLWRQDSKCIINNPAFSDNSLYAYNHLLYETKVSNNCNQWTRSVNKHGLTGIETGYEQVSQLSLYV